MDQAALKSRIDRLQIAYVVLFLGSIAMLVGNWFVLGHTPLGTGVWAVTLGSAVLTRIYRTSLVNRYNAMRLGADAPMG